jgi:type I restriction enzyme S subunit
MIEQVSSLKTGVKYKDTPIGKVPVDWEAVKLRDISLKFYNGGTPNTTNEDYWDGNIPWVTGADFEKKKVYKIRRYITNEGVKNSATNVISKGNLLIVTRTGVGKLAIATFDIAISQDITGVILNQEKVLPEYIYWYLNYNENRLKALIQGTSINGLLRGDLESFFVSLPPFLEQKKIAEILTTVDVAIEKTTQIIEKAEELKKGLMQRLLTRGIGHKKSKKTEVEEIPEEWDVGQVSSYGNIITGNTPSTSEPKYYGNEYPFVSPFDIGENKTIFETEKYLSKDGLAIARALPPNSVLVVCIGSTIGKTGIAGTMLATNQQINSVICENSDFNFVYYYLSFISKRIKLLSSTQAVPIINKGEFSRIKIPIPPIPEQKEIGNILSSVDNQIEKESNHKEQLELLKKGLMQVLLTGKLRVSI